MQDLQAEIASKTQAVLGEMKITPKKEEWDKFVKEVTANVKLMFKMNKKDVEAHELVVTFDENSKHAIPVLMTFIPKKKQMA